MYLELKDVSTHNLKGFDLKIPLNCLVVITGPSGSGKSSLAFDTIARASQNFQTLLENYGNPFSMSLDVKAQVLTSLPPVIALAQGVRDWYPYKNVSEILNINALLSFLFMKFGKIRCSKCGSLNVLHSSVEVLNWFETLPKGTKIYLLLPLLSTSAKSIEYFLSQGFTRFLIDGKEYDLSEEEIPKNFNRIFLLLDRLLKEERTLYRVIDDLRIAQGINRGVLVFQILDGETYSFNIGNSCAYCGQILIKVFLRCKECKGQGYFQKSPCPRCKGLKWEKSLLESRIFDLSIGKFLDLDLKGLQIFLEKNLSNEELKNFITPIYEKAKYFGIDYLKLKTPVFELTLGERKLLEILLIFSVNFTGVLYILDEPTLGLDEENRKKLITLIREIIRRGNSFIVVEHDPTFIKEADFVVELGPQAAEKGGYLIRTGPGKDFVLKIPTSRKEYKENMKYIEVSIGDENYKMCLQGINLFSGTHRREDVEKFERLYEAIKEKGFKALLSEEIVPAKSDKFLIEYIGLWDLWKEILIHLPEIRAKGLTKRHLSFNTPEGVCQTCKGKGVIFLKEHDLTFTYLCNTCLGKRLNYEVLNLTYKGYKLYDILDFTFEEAFDLFTQHFKIKEIILWLKDLKLSYLKLCQTLKDLSGGEKFRLSLVKKLIQKEKVDFFFLYYPFQGLSLSDLDDLFNFFRKLNFQGITLVLYEPHPLAVELVDYKVN
ncbi:MAG: hypothetical protein ACK4K4_01970 [Caldimicrobium sp.]